MFWNQTKRVPITSALKASSPPKDGLAEWTSARDREIAKREADPRYHVTLKHVGANDDPDAEPSDAMLLNQIHIRFRKASLEADRRARIELENYGIVQTDVALIDARSLDAEYNKAFSLYVREMLVYGIVGGKAEYTRLWVLGGPNLLTQVLTEVRRFQEMEPDEKNG